MTGLELARVILEAVRPRLKGARFSTPTERGGVLEPGASFDVTDAEGAHWRVILARQS